MRAVLQRVRKAAVFVEGQEIAAIDKGMLILLGVDDEDQESDARELAKKCAELRIFNDDAGKMNLGCLEVGGEVIVVSQFTLIADVHKGRRPSFVHAARPELAEPLYLLFCDLMRGHGLKVQTGRFGTEMLLEIHNDGPVTIVLDTPFK
jgi:D-tyrosyl-tRNA(Tyr) deacylase